MSLVRPYILLVLVSYTESTRITEDPSDVTVSEGAPATLHCRTSPPSKVEWLKSGVPLPQSEGVLALPDGSLFFLSTRARDGGQYQCTVRGERGRVVRSRVARLGVRYIRSNFGQLESRVVTVVEGEVVVLPCLTPRGYPSPRVRWEREGEEVEEGRVLEGGALKMDRARVEDGGSYTCVAYNTEGEVRDEVVVLTVEEVITASSIHEVILVERIQEEEDILSVRVWVLAISLAVVVTLTLLVMMTVVCLRYRSLTLVPTVTLDTVDSERCSTSSYSSADRLLYMYHSPTPPLQSTTTPLYSSHHYASSPMVTCQYSQPFNDVLNTVGGSDSQYQAPHR